MKILFAHNNADLYGSSRSLLRLTSRLTRDGHAVRVVLPCEGPLLTALEKNAAAVCVEPELAIVSRRAFRSVRGIFGLLRGLPRSVRRLKRLIDEFQPDLAHSNTSVVLPLGVAARKKRIRHVWHIREFYDEFRLFWFVYQRYMAFYSDIIVCVSEAVSRQFSRGIRRRRVRVLHNGFPVDEFQPVPTERIERFRSRFGLTADAPLVGVVGRIKVRRKGQETFIRAAGRVAPLYPAARFMVIGSPYEGNESHLEELDRLADECGVRDRVVFAGDVDDIRAAFAALDMVVLPSGQPEPFGGVVIEAMAAGKPVIGTAIGGTVEQIEDGKTGRLVPPSDPVALGEAMAELLSDSAARRRMGVAGRRRYLRLFEFDAFYQRVLELYNVPGHAETAEPDGPSE